MTTDNGTANRGGGSGGNGSLLVNYGTGNGGSGVVIIRWRGGSEVYIIN
jgi:hypothetical protein